MKTTVERVDATTVKLTVAVEAERVSAAIDDVAERMAREVKVPGFRPGRVPRKVLERRVGTAAITQEAVREALPTFYADAVSAESLDVVGQPEIDLQTFADGEEATFTATVEVRPEIEVPDVSELQIAHPDWELTDAEVDEQIDMLRERFADLEVVDREAGVGDYLVVSITTKRGEDVVDEASGEDVLYRISDPEESDQELDRQLTGAKAGSIVSFTDTLGEDFGEEYGGAEVEISAIVKEVKVQKLPPVDDDFALMASEFDTADELVTEVRRQMAQAKLDHAAAELRGKVVEAVVDLMDDVPVPKSMVDEELRFRLSRIAREAERHGMDLDAYLDAVGQSPETLTTELEAECRKTVAAQLVVDAVGRAEDIEVTREDLTTEIQRQAARLQRPVQELAELMTHPDRIGALVSDAFRRKAIDHLLDTVQVLSGPPEGLAEELAAAAPEPAEDLPEVPADPDDRAVVEAAVDAAEDEVNEAGDEVPPEVEASTDDDADQDDAGDPDDPASA